MITTARDIIARALNLLGVLATFDTATAEEAADGLTALNGLLATLSLDPALVPVIDTDSAAITAGTISITMGETGAINTARPTKIIGACVRDGVYDMPLRLLSAQEYQNIPNKSQVGKFSALYPAMDTPLITLYLWPVPDRTYTLIVSSNKKLTSFTALSDQMLLSDEYAEMLACNLAVRLAPTYGRSVPIELAAVARTSLAAIKRNNHATPRLSSDTALTGKAPYNIYTDC